MSTVAWEQPRRSRGRRTGVVVAALALLGALGWLAWPGWSGGDGPEPAGGRGPALDTPAPPQGRLEVGPETGEDDRGEAEPPHAGWRILPHAPLVRRYGHSVVWTGRHLLVWGGARSDERPHGTGLTELRSGASYDLAARRWRRLPPSPLEARLGHVAVAAGGEMVVWGGQRGGPAGASYDPVEQRWSELPPGPVDAARPRGAAWTGRLVLVWGSLGGRLVAAAYEPATGSWRELPDPPFETSGEGAEVVWVDGILLLWEPPAQGTRALVASWAPGRDRWRLHRPASAAPGPVRLLAAGDHVLAWGGREGERWALSYHPSSRTRQDVAPPPIDPEAEVVAGRDGEGLVVWSSADNRTVRVDLADGRASAMPGAPLEPRAGAGGVAWPGGLAVWGGASAERHYADGAVLDLDAAPAG